MKLQPIYVAVPSKIYDNSWNVIRTDQRNAWGEVWIAEVALTQEQAIQKAHALNALILPVNP